MIFFCWLLILGMIALSVYFLRESKIPKSKIQYYLIISILSSFILFSLIVLDGKKQPYNNINILKIGIADTIAPYVYYDKNNNLIGLEIDILKDIAKEKKLTLEFTHINLSDITTALHNNDIDIAIGGLKTGELPNIYVEYSDSYMESSLVLYFNTKHSKQLDAVITKTTNDVIRKMLSGLSIGAQIHREDFNFLTKNLAKHPLLIKSYTTQEELISDVEKNITNFAISDKAAINYYILNNLDSNIVLSGFAIPSSTKYLAFVVKKGSPLKNILKNKD